MAEFDFEGLPEISGFGGGYEEACRKMVVAGVKWLRDHPGAQLKAVQVSRIYPDIWADSPDMEAMQDAMADAVGGDATGAMVCATTKHALYIHRNGWEKYVADLKKARSK